MKVRHTKRIGGREELSYHEITTMYEVIDEAARFYICSRYDKLGLKGEPLAIPREECEVIQEKEVWEDVTEHCLLNSTGQLCYHKSFYESYYIVGQSDNFRMRIMPITVCKTTGPTEITQSNMYVIVVEKKK